MKSNIISTTADSISSGGTVTGDLKITGDLEVDGGGSLISLDAAVTGDVDFIDGSLNISTYANSSGGQVLKFRKSRDTSDGGHTIVDAGDALGGIEWAGSDGTNFDTAAKIVAEVDGNPSAGTDMPGRLKFYTTPDGSATPVEQLRINRAGNIGIKAAAKFYFDGPGQSGDTYIDEESGNLLRISVGGSNAMKLNANSRISLSNNDLGTGNTTLGDLAGEDLASGGNYNTLIGHNAGLNITTGDNNVAIGANSLDAAEDGAESNVAVGMNAMTASTSALQCVAVGAGALGVGTTTGDNNVAIGFHSLEDLTDGHSNTAVGTNSAASLTVGLYNTAIGYDALAVDTDGNYNVSLGYKALKNLTGSDKNVAIGYQAMKDMDDTADELSGCVAIGYQAFKGSDTNTTDATNGTVAIGLDALSALTTGGGNCVVGYKAGQHLTSGANNTVLGYQAFQDLDVGGSGNAPTSSDNVFIGKNAGGGAWTDAASNKNTAVGTLAMDSAMNGALENTAIGYSALSSIIDGDDNVAVGKNAGALVEDGVGNTLLGKAAADSLVDGSNNTIIGSSSEVSATGAAGQIVIGKGVTCTGDNTITVGIDANTASLALNGSSESWSAASSDERLKENIKSCEVGLDFINELRPVTYNWKKANDVPEDMPQYKKDSNEPVLGFEYGVEYHGFIAQEVKSAIDKYDGIKESFNMWQLKDNGTQTVAQGAVVPMLVKAIQELSEKIEKLENK